MTKLWRWSLHYVVDPASSTHDAPDQRPSPRRHERFEPAAMLLLQERQQGSSCMTSCVNVNEASPTDAMATTAQCSLFSSS